jgi:hypothetical protein
MKKRLTLAATVLALELTLSAHAATSNGNDFALSYHEANTPDKKSAVLKDAEGRPHFFRYLKILEMTEGDEGGRHYVDVTAVEPASSMNVKLRISASNSLALLKNPPETKVGDAIAVTGKVNSADTAKNTILLDSSIVRHKDVLSRKPGKELLSEVDPTALVYSYTEGPRPIMLQAQDKVLLESRDKILAEGGPEAWFKFLETEIAKRKAQRAAERQAR